MPKKNNIVWLNKTREDQENLEILEPVKFSLVDNRHIQRFLAQVSASDVITEKQRELIKKLKYKYRKQIKENQC